MLNDVRRQSIEKVAQQVIEDDGIESLPIEPREIAERRGISVTAKARDASGVSGMLIRHNNSFAIVYATHVPSEGFQRFSIGHELGHFFVDGHPEHIFAQGEQHASMAGFGRGDNIELEADHFAAALLMPRKLFVREMDRNRDGLAAVEALTERCKTSWPATAIRYAEMTAAPVVVLVSTGSKVDYCFMSRVLREQRGLSWVRKGFAVPRGTATYRVNADPCAVERRDRADDSTDLSTWFPTSDLRGEITEEVIGLGEYGRTLTILSVSIEAEEDEPDDDEDDAPAWDPPTFHRSRRR